MSLSRIVSEITIFCLAYVTACDLEQSFNGITTIEIVAHCDFLINVSKLLLYVKKYGILKIANS